MLDKPSFAYTAQVKFYYVVEAPAVFVGPCHHGMGCPQVADGGTASDMEGSCE